MLVSQLHCSSGRGQALPALAKNNSLDCFSYASRQLSHTPKFILSKCLLNLLVDKNNDNPFFPIIQVKFQQILRLVKCVAKMSFSCYALFKKTTEESHNEKTSNLQLYFVAVGCLPNRL
jgi:hypothetical protein